MACTEYTESAGAEEQLVKSDDDMEVDEDPSLGSPDTSPEPVRRRMLMESQEGLSGSSGIQGRSQANSMRVPHRCSGQSN